MKRALSCLLGIAMLLTVALAAAQTYPAKPIRFIVPFPAGGIADLFARVIGQKFNEAWGQPAVVENRPGAGGNIGVEIVAKSPPDGYTLVMEAEGLLVLHPSVPAKTVKELIALARARPGQFSYASAGNGTASHLAGELFKSMK